MALHLLYYRTAEGSLQGKLSTLQSAFTGGQDTSLFAVFTEGAGVATQANDYVEFAGPASTAGNNLAYYDSVNRYDGTNTEAVIELLAVPDGRAVFKVYATGFLNQYEVYVVVEGGRLKAYMVNAGTSALRFDIAYSATNHRWIKYHNSGGSQLWSTSPDRTTWTQQHSELDPFNLADVRLRFGGGTTASTASPGVARFDNLNVVAAPNVNAAVVGGGGGGGSSPALARAHSLSALGSGAGAGTAAVSRSQSISALGAGGGGAASAASRAHSVTALGAGGGGATSTATIGHGAAAQGSGGGAGAVLVSADAAVTVTSSGSGGGGGSTALSLAYQLPARGAGGGGGTHSISHSRGVGVLGSGGGAGTAAMSIAFVLTSRGAGGGTGATVIAVSPHLTVRGAGGGGALTVTTHSRSLVVLGKGAGSGQASLVIGVPVNVEGAGGGRGSATYTHSIGAQAHGSGGGSGWFRWERGKGIAVTDDPALAVGSFKTYEGGVAWDPDAPVGDVQLVTYRGGVTFYTKD